MNRNTSDIADMVGVRGEFIVRVFRADGRIEQKVLKNQVTANGLNTIAARALGINTPAWGYVGVGTLTATPSLGSTNFGEVSRKAFAGGAAASKEWIFGVATWGGAADSVSGVVLDSGVIGNVATSGGGYIANIVTGLATTLADSDFLNLTVRIRVGSHAL